MKRFVTGTVIVLVTLALAACAPAAPTAAPTKPAGAPGAPTAAPKAAAPSPTAAVNIKRGGTLRVHRQNDWESMDPQTSQVGRPDATLVYDTLVRAVRNPQTGVFEIKGLLADSIDTSNPKAVIFKLHQGVKFHDGSDFNAEVAKWNLDRLRTHPKSTAKEFVADHESVDVIDPYTVRINLKAPSASVLANLTTHSDARPAMLSKAHWEKAGDEGVFRESVGTGPYRFVEWKTGDHVTYKRFENYWRTGDDGKPLPYIDEVLVRFIPDWAVAIMELKAGNIDLVTDIAGKDVAGLKADPNLVVLERPWQGTIYFWSFNAKSGAKFAGDNMKKVRQAMQWAIDKEAIGKALGFGIGKAAYQHLSPGHLGYNEKILSYRHDPAKAKQLLAEAGFPNGIDAALSMVARPEDLQNAQMYKQMLDAVGVRTTIDQQERVALVKRSLAGEYEFDAWRSGFRLDPDAVLGFRYSSKGSGNYALWENADMDKCLEEGRSTFDQAQRQKIYERCETLANEEAYYGWMWTRLQVDAMSKALKGWEAVWSDWGLDKAWLDR
ncbi:MAG: ABC transporter substrate-binding protein [Bacteroidetes bacterium]|nr:ABC transporter substrate-binding protein [Bacteroidota bacterium]MCL5025179.1 ABC transporter substrate-binding protein [Chloroflexota bacterium]